MNFYNSSPFNTAINESNDSLPSFSPSLRAWQQPVPAQEDFSQPIVHLPSQSVTSAVPPSHIAQFQVNTPLFPRPSIYDCQHHYGQFSLQDDTVPRAHILPRYPALPAVPQRHIAPLNASMPSQLPLPHSVDQDTFPVQGDPSALRVPSEVVSPTQTKTFTHPNQFPCRYCTKKFKRNQELKRHLLSNLPDSILCPFPLCPWTGHRRCDLMKHIKKAKHPNGDPGREFGRKDFQIYDPTKFVQSMANGTLTVEHAADIALSRVEKRFEEHDKAGVKASVWGSRRKFCTARNKS